MDEQAFNACADATLTQIEQALEQALKSCAADIDFELKDGGVLELEFADRSKIIINRHSAAREIWVAAKSGGFHFRHDGQVWRGTRDAQELFAALSGLIGQQSGEAITLGAPG